MPPELAGTPFTPVEETLPRLESLVSPYTGVVRSVVEFMHGRGESRLTTFAATLAETDEVLGLTTVAHTGSAHASRAAARAAAIAEAVERYSATADERDSRPLTCAAELGDPVLPPERFSFFVPEQYAAPDFPFVPYTPTTRLRFCEALALPSREPVLVPAQLVYLSRPPDDEELIAYPTSNGLACAGTFEEAVLGGLLELVERDAFMIAWTNRLSLPLLGWSDDPEPERLDREYFAPSGRRYAALDASCFFGIPTVFGVVRGAPGDAGILGVGAAAAPTVQDAVRKALAEAFSVQRGARDLALNAETIPAAHEIRDFDDHLLYYCDPANARRAAFLDASEERRRTVDVPALPAHDVESLLETALELLARENVSAYAADVTTPDIRATGLVVARVLSPELCPLDVLHLARFLGPRRLFHAAHERGLRSAPLTLATANHDPHPFP
jgi:ribosomal protein S12 methylthiotransferase accessory factor